MEKLILLFLSFFTKNVYAVSTVPQPPTSKFCNLKLGDYIVQNALEDRFCNIADIINKLIPYFFTFAGIALLVVLIASGFSYLTSGGDEKKVSQAQGKITAALAGFIIIIAAYWLTQIVEYLFHIKIF